MNEFSEEMREYLLRLSETQPVTQPEAGWPDRVADIEIDREALQERNRKLQELQAEIEPYALYLDPEVVMYKAPVNTPSLAKFVEKFLTIMRSA